MAGKSKDYPTYAEAQAAGVFHPNCTHRLEYIDEPREAGEMARQAALGKPTADEMADEEAMHRRQRELTTRRHMEEGGLSRQDAERQTARDEVETAVRHGLFDSAIAKEAAASAKPEDLDTFYKGELPRIQYAKKGEQPGFRMSSRGGVLRVERGAGAEEVVGGLKAAAGRARGEDPEREAKKAREAARKEKIAGAKERVKQREDDRKETRLEKARERAAAEGRKYGEKLEKEEAKQIEKQRAEDRIESPELKAKIASERDYMKSKGCEYFSAMDSNGNMLFDRKRSGVNGGKLPKEWFGKLVDATMVHNHPGQFMGYGTSLSFADVVTAADGNMRSIRAVSPRRDYVMTREGKWPHENDITRSYLKAEREVNEILSKRMASERITRAERDILEGNMIWKRVAKETGMSYKVLRHKEE